MKKLLNSIILIFTCIILQSCSCAIYEQSYEATSKSRTISPFLVSEFAKAKDYKRNVKRDYYYKGSLSLRQNNGIITLHDSFCPNPVNIFYGNLSVIEWSKENNQLKEWFDAMGIPLKSSKLGVR